MEPVARVMEVSVERRPVGGRPPVAALRGGRLVQAHQYGDRPARPGELLAQLAVAEERGDLLGASGRARSTAFTWPRSTPYCWVGTDGTVRSTAAFAGMEAALSAGTYTVA